MPSKNKKHKNKMADLADRHVLYQKSVQCVEAEIDFIDETFEKLRGRKAVTLREDFCGTMNTSCEWIRRRDDNVAWSVDLDEEVLDWGRKNNIAELKPDQQMRIKPVHSNVLDAKIDPVDCILAMNFSYWILKERATLKKYFKKLYNDLVEDGILFLDCYGGYEAFQELEESTKHKNFTYTWDQASYNPINGHCTCHIHFKFKDGSKMKNAFSYTWRLWTMPEIIDLLYECRFKPTVYWEGTDEDGEGNGIFEPAEEGEADAGWIAYIVCEKA